MPAECGLEDAEALRDPLCIYWLVNAVSVRTSLYVILKSCNQRITDHLCMMVNCCSRGVALAHHFGNPTW